MWLLPVLILSAASSALPETPDFYFPILSAPKNLAVDHESDTTIVVYWEFPKSRGPSVRRVEFVLLLENANQPVRTYNLRFRSKPLRHRVTGLLPDTEYTVRVVATCPNWRDSATAGLEFVTLERDWPTPLVTSLSQRYRNGFAEYSIEWRAFPLMPQLSHFEIELCGDPCSTIRRNRSDHNTKVPVYFNTDFTLRVIACYELPILGKIRRFSKHFPRHSGTGPPARILETTDAAVVGNKIKLKWHPPFAFDGPITYYEFFVSDPSLRSGILEDKAVPPERSRVALRFPEQIDDVYDLRLGTDDDSAIEPLLLGEKSPELDQCEFLECNSSAGSMESTSVQQYRRADPLLLYVLEKTTSAVRFRVIFQKSGISDSLSRKVEKRHLLLGPGVAVTFGFSAHTMLDYRIRSCITYEGRAVEVCGNFTHFKALSNVAKPSEVRGLAFYFESPLSVVITWREPAAPRGPIDGYKVLVRRTYGYAIEDQEFTLDSSARSFVIPMFQPRKTYEVRVAAFNLNRVSNNETLRGDWEYVWPSPGRFDLWMILFSCLAILLTIALIGRSRRLNG